MADRTLQEYFGRFAVNRRSECSDEDILTVFPDMDRREGTRRSAGMAQSGLSKS
jgi:hypothetical protein